jgi:hypothetical protein
MKLISFEHSHDYLFALTFENGISKETDLRLLIEKYVDPNDLSTGQINSEWGCLEFNNGLVDIEPKTLYKFSVGQH